ncbi:hypothetical protein FC093_06415 [Ilyomonas limi]|uniref:Uncharacterized protein n=1 Tax=Ilyomonas limi TaxID=2575867 RepID=A0A4U3L8Y6_9BACT|nr:hypothetical protein [Ilyomonas limi]TKK70376.1 hypothetical protein FC093_06415 [Ilyomonas limi]
MEYREATQQQMFLMIASWQQSGLTQKDYCEQHSVRYHVFHYWYKKYRDTQLSDQPAGFIPLQIQPSAAASNTPSAGVHTEMVLPNGRRLLFHRPVSVDYLKALIS